jgi:hypothetical protein
MSQISQTKDQFRKILPQFFITPVTHTPVTYTNSNIEADETGTDGTPATITVYIVRKSRPWNFDKAGFIEGGDATMLVKYDQTISRGDKIAWNGNNYRIQTVLDRDQLGGDIAYKACNLFKI